MIAATAHHGIYLHCVWKKHPRHFRF